MPGKRIVSLLPAATEIVCALGLENLLVGRSHECDFPAGIQHLPVCTSASINSPASSLEIDRQVKQALTDALAIYSVDKELIRKLQPDIVITQAQCEVCAVNLSDVQNALQNLLDKDVEIISLSPDTIDDILYDIQHLGNKLGVAERGDTLLEEYRERIDLINHKLKYVEARPKVACIEWIEPLMMAGNWTPQLVEIAGGRPLLTSAGKHSPYISAEDLIASDPEVIIVAACGFSVERTLQEINILFELPGWSEMQAVKNNRFYVADGNQYFNRPGPRIIDTIEILAEIVQPKQFIFGYGGTAWLKFSIS